MFKKYSLNGYKQSDKVECVLKYLAQFNSL